MQTYLGDLFGLKGRVAVITGGSSGIGRAIAIALARAGARVVLVARDQDRLIQTVDELKSNGCCAGWVASDLSDRDQVRAASEFAVEAIGEPDILVHSAGVNLRPSMDELDEPVWDTTMALNLTAPFLHGQRFGQRWRSGARTDHPHQLPTSPPRVRQQRRLRSLERRIGVPGSVAGRSLVTAWRHLQRSGPRFRDDCVELAPFIGPREGGSAG